MVALNPHAARDRLAEMAVQVRAMAGALSRSDTPGFMILTLTS